LTINYFSEKVTFKFSNKRATSNWLKQVITSNNRVPGEISFIFCSDEQLLEINKTYLKHFYYTDVITFNYNEKDIIHGDVYISVDRIEENARNFNEPFRKELLRVMVHGVLHLLGKDDSSAEERNRMHELEDLYLKQISI
jgi:rRNA maturation RNase YbeY